MSAERAIRIEADGVRLYAILATSPSADAVWDALPLEGPAIALFFGRTPASAGPEPAAASPVNVFGRITGDAARLGRVRVGARVRLTRLES